MKEPYTIEIERMEPWRAFGHDPEPFPPNWNCSGYQRRDWCPEEATFYVTGRCGRISLKLCNACGIKFAAKYAMHLPGTEPGSTVREVNPPTRSGGKEKHEKSES